MYARDVVGNDIPVFFIQDAMKFPDVIHAGKPEPNNEVPTAQSAHNNFWDFRKSELCGSSGMSTDRR